MNLQTLYSLTPSCPSARGWLSVWRKGRGDFLRVPCPWRAISILLVTAGMFAPPSVRAQRAPGAGQSPASADNTSQGRALFTTNCGACHGADGRGGDRAPDVATASEIQQLSDSDLMGIVQHGVPGMGMPAFGALVPEKVKAIVDYLRLLQGKGTVVPLELPGDRHAGEGLFFGKAQCSTCHMVNGKGGFIASDLSLYGSHETTEQIRGVVTDPNSKLPARSNVTTVVTRAGERVTGIVRSKDNFSIALQTLDGAFQFFQRSDLKQIDLEARSLMPDNYGSTLNRNELNDLIAYLLGVGAENASHVGTQPPRSHDDDFGPK
jgi:cytochrome c oxidase cbb3-type subunit III